MPGIQDAAGKVTNALTASSAVAPYTGGFVAQSDPGLVSQAIKGYTDAAAAVPSSVSTVQTGINNMMGVTPVTSSTYTGNSQYDPTMAIQAATSPIYQKLMEQTLPGLRSSAIDSGAYTGDRSMSLMPAQVIRDAVSSAQNAGAAIGLQANDSYQQRALAGYQTDAGNALEAQKYNNTYALQSAQALPDLVDEQMKLRTSAGDLNNAALGVSTTAAQAAINDALQKYDYSIKSPYQGLDIAAALLGQLSGNYGTTTSNGTSNSTQVQTTGGLGNVVGGILGAASSIASLPTGGGGTLLGSLFKKGS
jgi:hypothetical protein